MKVANVRFLKPSPAFSVIFIVKYFNMKRWLPYVCFLLALLFSLKVSAQNKPHFNHYAVYVTDLERATNFYRDVMMLDIMPEPFHDGHHTWFALGNHGQLHVISGAKEDVPHDISVHFSVSVASLDDFMKHLDKMGVKYGNYASDPKKIQMRPDKVEQIYFQDPDGYWIEVNNDPY